MGKLDGKAAIITGSASGLGRATALLFAEEGAQLLLADYDEVRGRQVADDAGRRGGKAIFVKVDVSKPEEVERMVQTAVNTYGRLDVLFNNAGIEGEVKPTAEYSVENWQRVIGTNLSSVFYGMKYAIPHMLKNGGGAIINMGSTLSFVAAPAFPAYSAAKGGVLQLTKATALEYASQGIRVNSIHPGNIWTAMQERVMGPYESVDQAALAASTPVGRFGRPEEIAKLALFLATDDSSFCTGAPFIIDGGYLAR